MSSMSPDIGLVLWHQVREEQVALNVFLCLLDVLRPWGTCLESLWDRISNDKYMTQLGTLLFTDKSGQVRSWFL